MGNNITENSTIEIDLGYNGVTDNDSLDTDTGPNDLLNYPVITETSYAGTDVTVHYDLDVPAGDYRIEFFYCTTASPSGHGGGVQLLDAKNITHPGTGATSFSAVFAAAESALISATCTEDLNNGTFGSTSEFSLAVPTDYLLTK